MIRLWRVLASVSIAMLIAALPAVATAHAELQSSTPVAGENVATPPTEVTLTFDDELDPDGSSFTVVDADGHQVGAGGVDLTLADRNVMSGEVTITAPGLYAVDYDVIGLDGHPVTGTFSFGYAAADPIPGPMVHEGPDTAMPRPPAPVATHAGLLLLLLAVAVGVRRLALR